MRFMLLILSLLVSNLAAAEDVPSPPDYDAALAKRLGADERGMKAYVLVILKNGAKTDLPESKRTELFSGHMANIGRLADEGKLVVAGPLDENERNYAGIFIFNVNTVKEAEVLLATDPAVSAGALAYEAYGWYGSAALQETFAIHKRIDKTRH
jgi:uncharacterized protein